jgi:hypothetical protein
MCVCFRYNDASITQPDMEGHELLNDRGHTPGVIMTLEALAS